jgi:hypothetical protein
MYPNKRLSVTPLGTPAAQVYTAAAVHTYSEILGTQVDVCRLMNVVSTAVVSTGAVVLRFLYRPVPNSAAGQVILGTLSIPAATAAGICVYKDIDPVTCAPGGQIVQEVTTIAAGGGAAGAGVPCYEANHDPDYAPAQSSMLESA